MSDTINKYHPKFEHVLHEVPEINKKKVKTSITLEVFHLVLEYIFYPEKRDKIYEAFELLFQGLNAKEADEIFTVLIKYLLAATDETPEEAEEKVKHLPKGGETVRTTAEVLREEGYHKAIQEKPKWIEQGELKNAQEMLIKSLKLRFDLVKPAVKEQIRSIQSVDTLNDLFELSFKCSSMEEFTERLNEVTES